VRKHGDPQEWKPLQVKAKKPTPASCRMTGCPNPVVVKKDALCWAHYLRQQRKGSAEAGPVFTRGDDLGRYWAYVDKNGPVPANCPELGPCHPWTGYTRETGYGRLSIDGRLVEATRYLISVVLGEPLSDDQEVCHHCDNPPCQNRRHLFVSDHLGNIRDMDAKGRCQRARGEETGQAKFTEVQVREIRARHQRYSRGPNSARALGREFGVYASTIERIVRRDTWKHI
jgi:hypothetical protein